MRKRDDCDPVSVTFSHQPPTRVGVGNHPLSAWALETHASNREKEITVQRNEFPIDPALPAIGFERNEPFRRLLGDTNLDLPIRPLDPGVVYHSKGRTLARPSSVEGWIEAGSEWFTGSGFRDFWESVWNLSVAAWNFLDEYGSAPDRAPTSFPYLHPAAWQGFKWNKLLFVPASEYAASFDIEPADDFRGFIDSQIRFAYGLGLAVVPMGLAAMALNAPSIGYRVERDTTERTSGTQGTKGEEAGSAWRIPIRRGSISPAGAPHQVFFETPIAGLDGQTVLLKTDDEGGGFLYYRGERELADRLKRELDRLLGEGWGNLDCERLVSVPGLAYRTGDREGRTHAEAEWPWLGPVRAYLEARLSLLG